MTGEVVLFNQDKNYWRKKIAELFKNPDVEKSVVREYTQNTTTRRCWLWRIDNMSYTSEELQKLYDHLANVAADSVNKSIASKIAKEDEGVKLRIAKKGW
jgi:hypothetical protein|tara:strand:+ start:174 stop:473 length:300 start_codon:yes stop_codon:yes gene_type:complete